MLQDIQNVLMVNGSRLAEFGLPEPEPTEPVQGFDPIDVEIERQIADEMLQNLNVEQRVIYNRVMAAVHNPEENDRLFVINAAAGSGKSYLFQALTAQLQGEGRTVIVTCPTGIAASIFKRVALVTCPTGIAASIFKELPFDINETPRSSVTPTFEKGRVIAAASLLIIDEISMVTSLIFNIIERALRDICQDERPFGHKYVLLGGDARQTLPIVIGGDRCIKSSRHWPLFSSMELHTNVRALENQEFYRWLLNLGNGLLPPLRVTPYGNIIQIPQECYVDDQIALIDFCFDTFFTRNLYKSNSNPNKQHQRHYKQSHYQPHTSADSVDTTDDPEAEIANYTIECLNSLTPSCMSPHRLILKPGVLVMLIRNLNIKQGLCNGTRLIVRQTIGANRTPNKLNLHITESMLTIALQTELFAIGYQIQFKVSISNASHYYINYFQWFISYIDLSLPNKTNKLIPPGLNIHTSKIFSLFKTMSNYILLEDVYIFLAAPKLLQEPNDGGARRPINPRQEDLDEEEILLADPANDEPDFNNLVVNDIIIDDIDDAIDQERVSRDILDTRHAFNKTDHKSKF
ncbi:hypothetical protein NQ315_017224 [Exocentrus adspersus]|uniref:ATP-dependent DNA helicase n=1 Tax=Exocentrus adspersus TaxID=1586481 RepID=A0AAV8V7J8_9CUCU|nr:hypothetical protein NQ315_017224 [Exocentrus adspersus]